MVKNLDYPVQSQMIDLPDGRFHYLSWGAERFELPAAVLLHGITSSAPAWVRVGPALADRYRVFALDMRGHGDSIKPPAGVYSLRHTADDAAAFIEALGLERPLLMGHSWGGATAIVLASRQNAPAFSHVILEDPAYHMGRGDPARFIEDIGRSSDELRVILTANNPDWAEADIEGKVDAMLKVSREAVISVFQDTVSEGNILPLLAQIAAPTLLIRADANLGTTLDESGWTQARQLLSAPSQAIEITGATHNIHRTRFEKFMQVVNDFLR